MKIYYDGANVLIQGKKNTCARKYLSDTAISCQQVRLTVPSRAE